jgi:hypothetical protein
MACIHLPPVETGGYSKSTPFGVRISKDQIIIAVEEDRGSGLSVIFRPSVIFPSFPLPFTPFDRLRGDQLQGSSFLLLLSLLFLPVGH